MPEDIRIPPACWVRVPLGTCTFRFPVSVMTGMAKLGALLKVKVTLRSEEAGKPLITAATGVLLLKLRSWKLPAPLVAMVTDPVNTLLPWDRVRLLSAPEVVKVELPATVMR